MHKLLVLYTVNCGIPANVDGYDNVFGWRDSCESAIYFYEYELLIK